MQKLLGILIIMGCVVGGFIMSGGSLSSFWQPGEIIIILGAGIPEISPHAARQSAGDVYFR